MRAAICMLVVALGASLATADENWPQLLGPRQNGHSSAKGLPIRWSESENIRWKTAIPGEGWSSPVIWGNQVWMTTATEHGTSRRAICVEKQTGKIIHDVEVFAVANPQARNPVNSHASPTPCIEEGRVYVCFGTDGSACLDTQTGRILWKNQSLKLDHMEGAGSSPVLYKDLYILNCDGTDVQYVAALDKNTGQLAWKTARSINFDRTPYARRKAFATNLITQIDGKDRMISVGAGRVYCYDPADGREVWCFDIPGYSNVPMPIYSQGMLYVCTGFDTAELWAVKVDGAEGDITRRGFVWNFRRGVSLKPTPLLIGDCIYLTSDSPGVARCVDAATGEMVWQRRTGPSYSASPLYAGGHMYFFSERGVTHVIKPGREAEVVAENELEGGCMATPAISGKAFYVRTKTHLYRIEE